MTARLDRRRHAFRDDLADERLRGRVEAARFTAGQPRQVVAPLASLHRAPSADSGIDTQALHGESVLMFEQRDGWAWVQLTGDGYVGFLSSDTLADPPTDAPGTAQFTINSLRTFILPTPGLKLPARGFLSFGSTVRVAANDGDYARLADGSGFVYARHLRPVGEHVRDFVEVAERFIETPYLWGGKSSLGVDCSGLVQLALTAAGIPCPRDSDMQEAELGRQLSVNKDLSGLQRGDLVFWKGHVAIMLDADNIVHANGWTMTVSREPLAAAERRIRENTGGAITCIRRLEPA